MNLSDYELLPAVVVDVKDELCLGRIKASVPGGESPDNTQVEAMPWLYPMFMTGTYQGFTKLLEGSKIWVLRNKLDKLEMWYWPMVDLNPNTQAIVNPYDNPDVLISRNMGGQNVYIYYTDGQGIVLSIGASKININEKGEIIATTGPGQIKIVGENVLINTDSTDENSNAVKCKALSDCLGQICTCLEIISTQCNSAVNPLVSNIFAALDGQVKILRGQVNDQAWKSENVYLK